MLQWEKHRLALRANAPKRVKKPEWWQDWEDYVRVSDLPVEERDALAEQFKTAKYVPEHRLSSKERETLSDREITTVLDDWL